MWVGVNAKYQKVNKLVFLKKQINKGALMWYLSENFQETLNCLEVLIEGLEQLWYNQEICLWCLVRNFEFSLVLTKSVPYWDELKIIFCMIECLDVVFNFKPQNNL